MTDQQNSSQNPIQAPEQPVALVTGGAARIGKAMVETFHQAGFKVIVHCNTSRDKAEAIAEQLNAKRSHSACVLSANLTDMAAVNTLAKDALAAFGGINLLINNASAFYPTPIHSATMQQWNDLFGSNVQAAYFLSQALAPSLTERQGCILNITDIHAEKPFPEHSIYGMAKAALLMMSKALAQELAPAVRVNAIAPGAILWPSEQGPLTDTKEQQTILERTPLARIGAPSDIARTALFLATDAPFITGQVINVDGGRSLTV